MKTKRSNIGTIITGTLADYELAEAFASELLAQRPCRRAHRKLANDVLRKLAANESANNNEMDEHHGTEDAVDTYHLSDEFQEDIGALEDALQEYAPAYFYFGSHHGDGADIGYWLPLSFESDFDGLKVSDLSEVPPAYTGEVLQVNDHGNLTLYAYSRGRRREIWGVV